MTTADMAVTPGACQIVREFVIAGADAQGFHLAVEVGAFEAEGFGGAGSVFVSAADRTQVAGVASGEGQYVPVAGDEGESMYVGGGYE